LVIVGAETYAAPVLAAAVGMWATRLRVHRGPCDRAIATARAERRAGRLRLRPWTALATVSRGASPPTAEPLAPHAALAGFALRVRNSAAATVGVWATRLPRCPRRWNGVSSWA